VDGAAFTETQFNVGALLGSTLDYLVLEIAQCIFLSFFTNQLFVHPSLYNYMILKLLANIIKSRCTELHVYCVLSHGVCKQTVYVHIFKIIDVLCSKLVHNIYSNNCTI